VMAELPLPARDIADKSGLCAKLALLRVADHEGPA
jgi:hypothetical protein